VLEPVLTVRLLGVAEMEKFVDPLTTRLTLTLWTKLPLVATMSSG